MGFLTNKHWLSTFLRSAPPHYRVLPEGKTRAKSTYCAAAPTAAFACAQPGSVCSLAGHGVKIKVFKKEKASSRKINLSPAV